MIRKILHLDLDAFFCAVEELKDPSLKGIPFAVGGDPGKRGVVSSASYAARVFGVHSAMPTAKAMRLCPELRLVSGDHRAYGDYSRRVMAILADQTPFVEQLSIDEAFLDVTLRPEKAMAQARILQSRINEELRLPCSLGVATNKLVAKIANTIGKAEKKGSGNPPNAIKVVLPGEEARFLAPLPVRELWGIGPRSEERLTALGIRTIGDLAAMSDAEAASKLGKHGVDLVRSARGIDDSPVITEHEAKSVSREVTFSEDIADDDRLRFTLRHLSDDVGYTLRRSGLRGCTVKIKLRWSDFTTLTRQQTLDAPTDQDNPIFAAAIDLFNATWVKGKPVRLIGVGVTGFDRETQLSLFAATDGESTRLTAALDTIRERYGRKAVKRGSDLIVSDEW